MASILWSKKGFAARLFSTTLLLGLIAAGGCRTVSLASRGRADSLFKELPQEQGEDELNKIVK